MPKDEPLKVRLLKRGYTFYVHIPKEILQELGIVKGAKRYARLMATEVEIDKSVSPSNPFAWEIRLKPLDSCEVSDNHSHKKGDNKEHSES